jgi:hypothetical protein
MGIGDAKKTVKIKPRTQIKVVRLSHAEREGESHMNWLITFLGRERE